MDKKELSLVPIVEPLGYINKKSISALLQNEFATALIQNKPNEDMPAVYLEQPDQSIRISELAKTNNMLADELSDAKIKIAELEKQLSSIKQHEPEPIAEINAFSYENESFYVEFVSGYQKYTFDELLGESLYLTPPDQSARIADLEGVIKTNKLTIEAIKKVGKEQEARITELEKELIKLGWTPPPN